MNAVVSKQQSFKNVPLSFLSPKLVGGPIMVCWPCDDSVLVCVLTGNAINGLLSITQKRTLREEGGW